MFSIGRRLAAWDAGGRSERRILSEPDCVFSDGGVASARPVEA